MTGKPTSASPRRLSRPSQARTAFTLWELFMVLTVFGTVAGLVAWGLLIQLDTNKRLTIQSNRQAVREAVLHQLRLDMTHTEVVVGEAVSTPASRGDREEPAAEARAGASASGVRLHMDSGEAFYYIDAPPPPRHDDTSVRPSGPDQTLVRVGPDGSPRRWYLHGQTATLEPVTGAPALLRVSIESRSDYATGHRRLRRVDTTLYAGKSP